MIPAEEVARRNARRPGMRLVTYRDVGIPFWTLPVRCRFLERRTMPVLQEFVLKSVDAELRTAAEISRFLAVPQRVAETAMAELVSSGHLSATYRDAVSGGEQRIGFVLSERGRAAVVEATLVTPEERIVRLPFDGMTLEFRVIAEENRWRPRELRDNDVLEIPAFPADPPEVGPSTTDAIALALRDVPAYGDVDLLAAIGIEGRREKFFVRAVALVFESADRPDDVTVNFMIDGRPSAEHDLAFARAEGKRKLGVVGALRSERTSVDLLVGTELLAQRVDDANVAALRRTSETYADELKGLQNRASTADGEDLDRISLEIEDVAGKLDDAEAALNRIPVRVLEVYEHPTILHESLGTATRRLLVVSPWIRAEVVNTDFVGSLERLLERGVQVSIAYGLGDGETPRQADRAVEQRLTELAGEHRGFSFVRLGDTHAKVLVKDSELAVVTSFNWMSFRGDPNRPFRDERGTLIQVPAEIDRLYEDYINRMAAVAVHPAGTG